jgi:Domain of unknown function (DUF4124)
MRGSIRALTAGGRHAAAALALGFASFAWGQAAPSSQIYTCVDASGKKLTSDRPIVECNAREQRVLNGDGSVRRILPPTMTADERSEAEARERDTAVERTRQKEESLCGRKPLA